MSINVTLARQRGSKFWFGVFPAWSAVKGDWTRKFQSTKKTGKKEAWRVTHAMAAAARAIGEAAGGATGWSRDKCLGFVNELEREAGLTVSKAVPSWKVHATAWMTEKALHVEDHTKDNYESALKDFGAWLGKRVELPVDALTPALLREYYSGLLSRGLVPSAANVVFRIVSRAFAQAVADELLQRNPCKRVTLEEDARTLLNREPFTASEFAKLVRTARKWEHGTEWETLILLGLCIGARGWSDCVKLGLGHLVEHPPAAAGGRGIWTLRLMPKKTAKKGKVIEVPVVEPLRARLEKLKRERKSLLFCPHLAQMRFPGRTFKLILEASGIQARVHENAKLGRKLPAKSFHSLRHTLPTLLSEAGVAEEVRMKLFGHSSRKTHQIYTHHSLESLNAAMTRALAVVAR